MSAERLALASVTRIFSVKSAPYSTQRVILTILTSVCFLIRVQQARQFGKLVGWHDGHRWLLRRDYSFSLDAPEGHFPSLGGPRSGWGACIETMARSYFLTRFGED